MNTVNVDSSAAQSYLEILCLWASSMGRALATHSTQRLRTNKNESTIDWFVESQRRVMSDIDDGVVAHLSMIQGIVNRLETNSFTLKALAMTLAAAVLAFLGTVKSPNTVFPAAGALPVIVFWLMDAQYLRLGRIFRRLYDAVRQGQVSEQFSMDYKRFAKDEDSVLRIAFSWSVIWFYASILAAFVTISIFLFR